MIGRTNTGGGGGGLNFNVVGGTSAPASPKENTIWINTSTTISDYVFSATQPAAATGRVWIYTGTSSTVEFNALKKNGIQVYPLSAKQYVSGEWVDKTAKSYQNGKWVSWIIYLLNGSDTNTGVTGGWEIKNGGNVVATLTNNGVEFTSPGGTSAEASIYTKNKIDVTNFSKLSVDKIVCTGWKDGNDSSSTLYFGLVDTHYTSYIYPDDWVAVTALKGAGTWEDAFVDLSTTSGQYYVAMCMDVGLGSANGIKLT